MYYMHVLLRMHAKCIVRGKCFADMCILGKYIRQMCILAEIHAKMLTNFQEDFF